MAIPIPIIGELIGGVGDYFNARQKIKAAEKERKDEIKSKDIDAKIELIRKGQASDITQDNKSREYAGWMDDISFYLFILPVPLSFFPGMVPHITAGFAVLESMPEYYQYTLGLMLASVWGYRRLVLPIVETAIAQWAKKVGTVIPKKEG